MKISKKTLFSIIILTFLILPIVAFAANVNVNPLTNLKNATPTVISGKGELPQIIGNAIKIILGLVGVALLVLIVYAGFLWGTSAGEDEKVKKAKTIIMNSVIGIIIIFAGYALTLFILKIVGVTT